MLGHAKKTTDTTFTIFYNQVYFCLLYTSLVLAVPAVEACAQAVEHLVPHRLGIEHEARLEDVLAQDEMCIRDSNICAVASTNAPFASSEG